MKQLHFILARTDRFGNRLILWQTGNYLYEIEDITSRKTLRKLQTSLEEAKSLFFSFV